VRRHRWQTVLGVVAGLSAFMIATSLFLWMSPTIVGLLLAIPLSWLSGRLGAGLALKRLRLLMIPEETRTPPIVARANALFEENQALGFDDEDAMLALYRNPSLRERHEAMLPPPPPRRRGDIDPEHVLAQAKIMEAVSIHDAVSWLKPKERMVVLHDRALLDQLTRLKPVAEPAE
jgi:membrane glycosyltransferase